MNTRILPNPDRIFAAVRQAVESPVSVVILGQDPYPTTDSSGTPKAHGNAFAYNPAYKGPVTSSLANIMQEIGASQGFDTSLQHWINQGVLLLNTELTVQEGKPLSHRGTWTRTVRATITLVENRDQPIYVAWGREAMTLLTRMGIPRERIIHTSHPCRYSNRSGKFPFTGSRWHERVNILLGMMDRKPINWRGTERDMSRDYAIDLASAFVGEAVQKGIVAPDTAMLIFDSLVDGLRDRSPGTLVAALQEITHE